MGKSPHRLLRSLDSGLTRLECLSLGRLSAGTFLVAFLPRALLVAIWQVLRPSGVFPDESSYIRQASEIAGGSLDSSDSNFWASNWAFFRPLVYLAEITEKHVLVGRLATATIGSLVAVVALLIGRLISKRIGIIAGLILALYPSQVLWSSMILKDTLSSLLLASICLAIAEATNRGTIRAAKCASVIALPLIGTLSGVRYLSALTLVIAVFLTSCWILARRARRRQLIVGACALVLALGTITMFASDRIPISGTRGNELLRKQEYSSARTLVSCDPIPFIPGPLAYESGWKNDFACSPFVLRMLLFDPLPNQLNKSKSLIPPFAENMLWWPLLGLAVVTVRKHRHQLSHLVVPMALGVGLVIQWALVDRVFGTAYRHRTEFIWIVVLLAAIRIDWLSKSIERQSNTYLPTAD